MGSLTPSIKTGVTRLRRHCTYLRRWLRAFAHWLCEARTFWLGAVVLAAAVVLAVALADSERALRLIGLGLQLLGIATVMVGIRTTRKQFGHPSLAATTLAWLRRFPHYGPRTISLSVGAAAASASVVGAASARVGHSDDSVEARLEALERDMNGAYESLGRLQADLSAEASRHDAAIDQEKKNREASVAGVRSMLESTQTGGLSLSAVGAIWLFMGVVLATAAPELTGILA